MAENAALRTVTLLALLTLLASCKGPLRSAEGGAIAPEDVAGRVVSALPDEIVSIYQAEDGVYWFGTKVGGVVRYDGESLRIFTREADGLAADHVRGVQEDSAGRIFFDTTGGVSRYDGAAMTTLRPIDAGQSRWRWEPEDLWFLGERGVNGVFRYDGRSLYHLFLPERDQPDLKAWSIFGSISPYEAYSVYEDSAGRLWFGTRAAGVYLYDGDASRWIEERELERSDYIAIRGVRSVIEDRDGHFWFGDTLHRYAIRRTQTVQGELATEYAQIEGASVAAGEEMRSPYFMSAVLDDANHDLWVATYGDGVWRYDGSALSRVPVDDLGEEVFLSSIYKDRRGVLWLATQTTGVLRFDGAMFRRFRPGG